jgi:hypothetical protein
MTASVGRRDRGLALAAANNLALDGRAHSGADGARWPITRALCEDGERPKGPSPEASIRCGDVP